MPLILFLLALSLFGIREYFERRTRHNRFVSYQQNQLNGYREYLYAWHYYWEDVVPAVYKEIRQRNTPNQQIDGRPDAIVFNKIGYDLLGFHPRHYACLLAKRKLISEGRPTYTRFWYWNDRTQKEGDPIIQERTLPPEKRSLYALHNVCSIFVDPPIELENDPEIIKYLPESDDKRRTHYQSINGQWYKLNKQQGNI